MSKRPFPAQSSAKTKELKNCRSESRVSALFVLPDLGKNGAIQQTLAIAEGVEKSASVTSTVYLLDPSSSGETKLSAPLRSSPVSHFEAVPFLRRLTIVSRVNVKVRSFLAFLFLLIEARKHDVVFAAFEAGAALTHPARAARLLRKPLFVIVHNNIAESLHTHWPLWPVNKTKQHLRRADHLIGVTQGLGAALEQFFGDDRMPPYTTVRNGIDVSALESRLQAPPLCEKEVDVASMGRFFVAIGRISPQKGFDLLIESHAKALKAGEEHVLLIAGAGPEARRAQLQAQANALGVGESVWFLGYCKNPIGLLRHAYGFCLTSRYEGFSLALAEAAAAGIPCIAMDCTAGPSEILEGGKYGDLVPDGDVEAMAQAMIAHLRDPTALRQKAEESRSERDGTCQPFSNRSADFSM